MSDLSSDISKKEFESSRKSLFRLIYSHEDLKWIQYFHGIFQISPKLVFLYENRVIVFFEEEVFQKCQRIWSVFKKKPEQVHIRIIKIAQNLSQFIQNWYGHLKGIEIHFKAGTNEKIKVVLIQCPKNLRQFVIGKNGYEFRMLEAFLNKYSDEDSTYKVQIQ
jgi:hypothetical protein